jgi:hypothetical protein
VAPTPQRTSAGVGRDALDAEDDHARVPVALQRASSAK